MWEIFHIESDKKIKKKNKVWKRYLVSLKLHKRSPSIRDENAINAIFVNNEGSSIPNKFVNIKQEKNVFIC